MTTDRCDGTLTQVKRGKVTVRDLRRKRTITLTAGKSYLAKALKPARAQRGPGRALSPPAGPAACGSGRAR